jgi:hypothetical protein
MGVPVSAARTADFDGNFIGYRRASSSLGGSVFDAPHSVNEWLIMIAPAQKRSYHL